MTVSSFSLLRAETQATLARPFQLLIEDRWVDAQDGAVLDVFDPASGAVIAHIPAGGRADIDAAVKAARRAFGTGRWSSLTPGARARIMWRVADLLEARAEEFVQLDVLDNGKPASFARAVDLPASIAALRYWAGWCTKLSGQTPTVDLPGEYMAMTIHEPVGVVGLITPWNFPLANAVVKLGPALAAGCTIVLKPAEQTSLSALRLGELLLEAGVPPGVVNIVTGRGSVAGAALAEHPDVDKISFTGSTTVGKTLLTAAQGNLKRLTLELGGKSPSIVFPDADLDRAISAVANGIFRNSGQVCVAGSRLFAHRSRFDQVVEGVIAEAEKHRLGPGLDPATTLGPLVSETQQTRVLEFIDSARREGATVTTAGSAPGDRGYFVKPTVIVGADPSSDAARQEIFGPVLVATPVDDLDQLAAYANDTIYGLSANIWTRDISSAYRLAKRIRAGTVTINSGSISGPDLPFGGFKQSGWGREGGRPGVEAFTEVKTIITAL